MIQGISVADNSVSYKAMAARQSALADAILEDPDVTSLTSYIGIDGTNTTLNNGRFLINLRAARRSLAERRADRQAPAERGGRRVRHQAVPAPRTGPDARYHGIAESVSIRAAGAEPAGLPEIRPGTGRADEADQVDHRRHQRSEQRGIERRCRGEPAAGRALRHHPGDHRQRALRCARPAHRLDHLQPVQSVSRGAGRQAREPAEPAGARHPVFAHPNRAAPDRFH